MKVRIHKALPVEPQLRIVRRVADRWTPAFKKAFLAAVGIVSGLIVVRRVQEALERGDYALAEAVIPWTRLVLELGAMTVLMRQNVEQAAVLLTEYLPVPARVMLRFDVLNTRAIEWIKGHSAELIKDILDDTQLGVRQMIQRAFETGIHPYQSARYIKDLVGLTENQMRAVDRLRDRLVKDGLPANIVADRVRTYAEQYRRYRAETIARTETMRASNEGQQLLWQQAVDEGYLDPTTVRRVWITARDGDVCEYCQALDGTEVALEEWFVSRIKTRTGLDRETTSLMPPLHPRCRCVTGLLV